MERYYCCYRKRNLYNQNEINNLKIFLSNPDDWRKIMSNIILISGGFDPIHSGHIKLINEANKHGDVVVLLIQMNG